MSISSGHDEYWSNEERANVEQARDAGRHLAFFSGNEMYWKTRWNTNYRTLISVQGNVVERQGGSVAAVDRHMARSRFSTPNPPFSDGGRPENAVSGQIFTVDCCASLMTVPEADGRMRLWRDTDLATTAISDDDRNLPFGVLGYEWDEDLDNGARPAGIVHMSTTTLDVPERVVDYGNNFPPGRATHHLTLYRKGNALVFGAGTVQWAWGIDDQHDGDAQPTDWRMQQAMVNLFADMQVQPATLQRTMRPTTRSSPRQRRRTRSPRHPPSVPSSVSNRSCRAARRSLITGTASDVNPVVSGAVGGVEISTDGGQTWHPAIGRETWSVRLDA